jgi:hypothetical protein
MPHRSKPQQGGRGAVEEPSRLATMSSTSGSVEQKLVKESPGFVTFRIRPSRSRA